MIRRSPTFALSLLVGSLLLAQPAHALSPLASPLENLKSLRDQAIEKRLRLDADGALDAYEQALTLAKKELGPTSSYVAQLYYDMGSLAYEAAKFEVAETYLTNAVRLNPSSASARVKLAELLRTKDRGQDAARQAQAAVKKHPGSLAARQELAMDYLFMHDSARSSTEFARFDKVAHGLAAPLPQAPVAPVAATAASTPVLIPVKQPEPVAQPPAKQPEQPPEKPKAKPKAESKPKPEPKPKPKPEAKPKPKPAAKHEDAGQSKPPAEAPPPEPKPKAEPKPKPEPKPEPKPKPESKPEPKPKPAKPKGGLVPPPPPVVPSWPGIVPPPPSGYGVTTGNPNYRVETKAQVIKEKPKDKPKPEAHEDKPPPSSSSGADDDFLLDWADKGGGKKKK